jgi:hypothetical protein
VIGLRWYDDRRWRFREPTDDLEMMRPSPMGVAKMIEKIFSMSFDHRAQNDGKTLISIE